MSEQKKEVITITRKDIMNREVESSTKAAFMAQLSKLAKESDSGSIGRIRDNNRNTAWRRLLGFSRDKSVHTDAFVSAHLEGHFELALAAALNNAQGEAVAKDYEPSVEDMERVIQYLGTRTAALKAFSPEESNDSEI